MRLILAMMCLPSVTLADSYIALRTIPARSILTAADLTSVQADIAGAIADPLAVVGQEARVTIFAGRPILAADFAPPALVIRNQIVVLIYTQGALQIVTEGRALDRAGEGEMVRVMNLASRATVHGLVTETGAVRVGPVLQEE
jgi:flagellar basal body P-ring formation protein FlgA